MQKPRITEINVRMDCNGCVQKVKKAINGIDGVYDIYIDLPQQKLIVIGRADPERIIKAIKKVRKVATICSHTEVPDQNSQPPETQPEGGVPPPEGGATGHDGGNPTSEESPKPEEPPPPPQEPPKDQPPENLPAQNPPLERNPLPPATNNQPRQQENPPKHKDLDNHVIQHLPPDYGYKYGYGNGYAPGYSQDGYGGQRNSQPRPSFRHGPPAQSEYHDSYHPIYRERPQPIYYEPPPPRNVYHEPPPRNVYHEQPLRSVFQEPPPRPSYQEPPQPSYQEPLPQSSYHEPPSRRGYHELPPQPVVYHEPPPQHGYREPPPVQVTHSYNTSRPSPYITAYQYVQSPPPPPPPRYTTYSRMDHYSTDPYWESDASYGNESSLFSDENPNACTIV